MRLLHEAGANVFFGDILDDEGQKLETELTSPEAVVKYIRCDVTSYQDNIKLFDAAFRDFGRIDHAWVREYGGLDVKDMLTKHFPEQCWYRGAR